MTTSLQSPLTQHHSGSNEWHSGSRCETPRRQCGGGQVMDLKGLRYFVHVADVGSVSAAARDLGIVQPALSRHIQRIEDEAGVQLFSRLPRGMELTAAGREFVEHCRKICQLVALAKAALGTKGSLPGGQLALGIPGS